MHIYTAMTKKKGVNDSVKKYECPEIEIKKFQIMDVVTTSGEDGPGDVDDGFGWG